MGDNKIVSPFLSFYKFTKNVFTLILIVAETININVNTFFVNLSISCHGDHVHRNAWHNFVPGTKLHYCMKWRKN